MGVVRKRWTDDEVQMLKDLYLMTSNQDLALTFDVTISSIINKLHMLGLVRPSRLKTHEVFESEIGQSNPNLVLLDKYTNSKTRVRVKSKICGHEWSISPNAFIQGKAGRKCPVCLSGPSKLPEVFEAEVKNLAPSLKLLDKYTHNSTYLRVRDQVCGHEWKIRPGNFLGQGTGSKCPVCTVPTRSNRKTHSDFYEELLILAPDLVLLDTYKNNTSFVRVASNKCMHEWKIQRHGVVTRGSGLNCPICYDKGRKSNSAFQVQIEQKNPALMLVDEYINCKTFITVKSKVCGHDWKILPDNFINKGTGNSCPVCTPKGVSKAETELGDFLAKHTEIIRGDRELLEGKEIDIFLPKFKLGIEYNGLYWHNEQYRPNKDYHLEKTELAASKGITLIQVFEHEDIEIVKSRLLSLIGKTYTLGARETRVIEIPFPKDFLIDNHIQGAGTPSKVNLGLFLKEELVATMTFSKPRFNANYEWELIRYCSLLNVTVVGGASKLLKYFIKSYCPKNILSYSDKRWSTGKLYKNLGFVYLQSSAPGYFYHKSTSVISRYKAQKHKLKELVPEFYDEMLTEREIMNNAGWFRVYDCGQDVWVLTL